MPQMKKPELTKEVLEGLLALSTLAEKALEHHHASNDLRVRMALADSWLQEAMSYFFAQGESIVGLKKVK